MRRLCEFPLSGAFDISFHYSLFTYFQSSYIQLINSFCCKMIRLPSRSVPLARAMPILCRRKPLSNKDLEIPQTGKRGLSVAFFYHSVARAKAVPRRKPLRHKGLGPCPPVETP